MLSSSPSSRRRYCYPLNIQLSPTALSRSRVSIERRHCSLSPGDNVTRKVARRSKKQKEKISRERRARRSFCRTKSACRRYKAERSDFRVLPILYNFIYPPTLRSPFIYLVFPIRPAVRSTSWCPDRFIHLRATRHDISKTIRSWTKSNGSRLR